MKLRILLAAVLAAPGLALAQQGSGAILTTGPGDFQFVTVNPGAPGFFDSSNFHVEATPRAFVVYDFGALAGEAAKRPGRDEITIDLDGGPALLTVEGDGVRLPDEQFSIP